jgi:hypothetical protein
MTLKLWPRQDTAFIVIHGMGVHRPFVKVDSFVRQFLKVLLNENEGAKIECHHQLLRHLNWIESYISLTAEDASTYLDFHEYYWDCFMVREITYAELLKWLEGVSKGAQNFYAQHPEIVKKHREANVDLFMDIDIQRLKDNVPLSMDDVKCVNYSRAIMHNIRWLNWLYPLIKHWSDIETAMKILKPFISKRICSFLQDLVIYTTSDARSQNYNIRKEILDGAVNEVKLLLTTKDCQIVLAGHSLGSVIAYDALNQVNLDMNVKDGLPSSLSSRIGGLVTFGSPLDKVYFLFKEPTSEEQYVRRQIVSQLYSYKTMPSQSEEGVPITNPVDRKLDKSSLWVNYYHYNDLISGYLDAYKPDEQVPCDYVANFFQAHDGYWTYDPMYLDIAKRYL